jgi:hypothetical protein
MQSGQASPRLHPSGGGSEGELCLEFLLSEFGLARLVEYAGNAIPNGGEQLHIEGSVGEPFSGKGSGGPVGSRVLFGEAQTQEILHDAL